MKKFLIVIILVLSAFLLISCNIDDSEISDKIVAPNNTILPISGEWIIEDYKFGSISSMDEETAESYIGKEVLFHQKLVAIGDDYCLDPSFKIKNVNTSDYLIYQYKTNPEFLNIEQDEIQIVSVVSKEQFFNEFIKESEERVIVNIDGVFFYLNKVSEKVEDEKIAEHYYNDNAMFRMASIKEDDVLKSGILMGLKSLDLQSKEDNIEKWNYRTIWIGSYNREIDSIYEMEDIFLPRKTGFWRVGVNREKIDNKINDYIIAYPQNKTMELKKQEIKNQEKQKENKIEKENTIKNILYVGNDYISLEKIHYLNKGERVLEFYPIDYLNRGKPIKISDVSGQIGQEAFLEGANKEIQLEDGKYKDSSIDLKPNEENFGLFRRNGHWIFKGRFNFIEDTKYIYKDFNIKCIPPKEVVYYDELSIPWNAIKSKIPEAMDAFISPNEDIAIIITHNNILTYLIDEGKIADIPVSKIKLKPTEKVIMAEWAIGRYPVLWEEEFLRNQATPIKE